MRVKEIIERLSKYPPEFEVVFDDAMTASLYEINYIGKFSNEGLECAVLSGSPISDGEC